MQAWRVQRYGEPTTALALDVAPVPEPGPGQVLISVAAAALNFPDVLLCQGTYQEKPELPFSPGLEVSGTVLAIGDGVTTVVPGQRVAAVTIRRFGGLAQRCLASEALCFPIPEAMDDIHAAALIVTYQTSWLALHRRARLQSGEVLLVHAGAGGVGSAAVQLGLAAGATVIATAGSPEKVAICQDLGAHHVIDYVAEDFVPIVRELTRGHGADVIVDPVGGDVFDGSRRVAAWEGRIVVVGFTSGRIASVPTNHALLKNYAVLGLNETTYHESQPTIVARCHADLVRLHGEGRVRPLVKEIVPWAEVPRAIEALEHRSTWGKLVVVPPAS
jgi:NADPH2:quinone reductase